MPHCRATRCPSNAAWAFFTGGLLALTLFGSRAIAAADDPPSSSLDRDVAPLLARRCLDCHNAVDKKGGLDLSTSAAAQQGGDSGPVIEPGSLDGSPLWERVVADEMPPKHPLAAAEKEILRKWIADGANWSVSEIDRFRYSSDTRGGYDWWSLQPVARPELPSEVDTWSRNAIDRLLHASLRERSLAPSAEADRRTLIRRVTFDLTGLPPAADEVEAFVNDPAADAYERLVDRLLASPHYGVRWARHWLDVVRYGESNGFEYDEFRPNAWPYRDWVVSALNADMPYDEFVRLQLAGDVLSPTDIDSVVATGFLAAGPYDTAGQNQQSAAMKAVVRQDELEDLVGVVGQTFLGLTVNCARCHDHKFDPIRQREYYQLAAALAGVRQGERDLSPHVPSGQRAQQVAELEGRRAQLESELKQLEQPVRTQLLAEQSARASALKPIAAWDFRGSSGETSLVAVGEGYTLKLHGSAQLTPEGLVLDGQNAYAATGPVNRELREKTLEAWVQLRSLKQRGGGAITVQSLDGATFDAIVFGERDPMQWLSGSDNFTRTQGFGGPQEQQLGPDSVHICITYAADGTISGYRDGKPYGTPFRAARAAAFAAGNWEILLGLRHGPPARGRMLAGIVERASLYDRALTADEVAVSSGRAASPAAIRELMPENNRALHEELHSELAAISESLASVRPQRVYAVVPRQPEATHLLARGNPAQALEALAAGGVASVAGVDADFQLPADAADGDRRLRLARWITDPRNPLFARVIVNRIWHHHFGVGLVDTPNDFGFNGGRPSNQRVLDWLSAELVEHGFHLKPIHRLIVGSAAYRQSSMASPEGMQHDAENRLLGRKSPARLEAEAVRDAMLTAAGVLDPRLGGPGFREQKIVIAEGTNTFLYMADDPTRAELNRRTLYRAWARSGRNSLLDLFDCPDPSTTAPKRAVTTTPLQALSLLNNDFVLQMAEKFAERVAREAGPDPNAQIALAYRRALARAPSEAEQRAALQAIEGNGLVVLARALFNSNEFVYVD